MSDPIPTIAESEASGEIAALYADIKVTLGVPTTNMVWRRLATIDGALSWTWNAVKPLYVTGALDASAKELRRSISIRQAQPWTIKELRDARIGIEKERIVRAVLANYDQTNPINLIAFTALTLFLNGEFDALVCDELPTADRPSPVVETLPDLMAQSDMPPRTEGLALDFSSIGMTERATVVSSGIARHLAHWHGFLALCVDRLKPLDANGILDDAVLGVVESARAEGSAMAGNLNVQTPPLNAVEISEALSPFVGCGAIARMIPIVCAIIAAMPSDKSKV